MRWNIRWRANENRVYIVLIVAYLVLTSGFGYLGYLENIERRIRGNDSVYYYSYLRSAFFDRDLNFENEWAHFYGAPENSPSYDNVFSIGPAILWTPSSSGRIATPQSPIPTARRRWRMRYRPAM